MTTATDDPFAALDQAAHRTLAETDAAKKLSRICAFLVRGDAKAVFFAALALRLERKPIWDARIPTAATNGKILYFNPDFILSLSDDELKGVMVHEVMHNALKHHVRRGLREPELWNLAADLCINCQLKAGGFTLPAGGLFPAMFKLEDDKNAEWYYDELMKQSNPKGNKGIKGPEGDKGGCGAVLDAGSDPTKADPNDEGGGMGQPSDAELQQADTEWTVAVAQAGQMARKMAEKTRGTLPGWLEGLIGAITEPKVDWREQLREFVSARIKQDWSWSPPNRRFVHQGLYLPSQSGEALGHIIIDRDTSGSCYGFLDAFTSEILGICEAYNCKVTFLDSDAAVHAVHEWDSDEGPPAALMSPVGGGGTSHVPVFEWIDEHLEDPPACVVCFTDCYTAYPDEGPTDYPVLWCVFGNKQPDPPFGQVIIVED